MPEISIIIRTKNEERWIGHCLSMLEKQEFSDFEIILVDNQSTDHTVEVAKRYELANIINIDKFRPGNAINEGIRASQGKYIVCLSAHCIPKNTNWLSILRENFNTEENIAAVYGRQLPVSFTDAVDKRDLLLVFGQDRRVQIKDYFFHNANSMFRRDVWEKYPFDEGVTNIEDRVWGKEVIGAGYSIIYDPEAAVYHHHGLHQGNSPERAKGVVSIIEQVDKDVMNELPDSLHPENAHIVAILPVLGKSITINEQNLLIRAIRQVNGSKYIDGVYVLSEDTEVKKIAEDENVSYIPRPEELLSRDKGIEEVLKFALGEIEKRNKYPEAILYVNHQYLIRPEGFFDELIKDVQYKGLDTAFAGFIDYGNYWKEDDLGNFIQEKEALLPRQFKNPTYRALYGLGCVSSVPVLRAGSLVGEEVGILPVTNVMYTFRCDDETPLNLLEYVLSVQNVD